MCNVYHQVNANPVRQPDIFQAQDQQEMLRVVIIAMI